MMKSRIHLRPRQPPQIQRRLWRRQRRHLRQPPRRQSIQRLCPSLLLRRQVDASTFSRLTDHRAPRISTGAIMGGVARGRRDLRCEFLEARIAAHERKAFSTSAVSLAGFPAGPLDSSMTRRRRRKSLVLLPNRLVPNKRVPQRFRCLLVCPSVPLVSTRGHANS